MAREQVTGKIGEEEVVLNNAASEATLEKLLKEVERRGTGGDNAEIQRLKKELQRLKESADKAGVSLGDFGDAANSVTNRMQRGLGHTADAAVGLTKEFVTGSMRISDFTKHITGFINQIPFLGILGEPLQLLAGFVDKNIDTFRELSTVGIDFGDSVFAAQEAAARSGLSLATFSQTVGQSSENLALLAGDASSGARRFREISSRVQESAFRFANLGLTLEETAAFTGDYLEQQTRLGQAQGMNNNRLSRQTTDYIDQLDKLARVTGLQREQVSEQLKQQALDKRLQGLLATMEGPAKETLQGVLSTVESASPDVAEAFKNMVATGGVPVTDFGRDLLRTNENLAGLARGLRDGSVTYEEAMAEFRRSGRIAKNQGDGMLEFTGTLAALGSEVGSAGLALLGFENIAEGASKVEQDRIDAMESGAKGFASFEASLTQARNEILGTLIDSDIFKILEKQFANFVEYLSGDGLEVFTRQINRFSAWFDGWVTKLDNGTANLDDMLMDFFSKMIEKIKPFFATLADIGGKALVAAIKAMFSNPVVTLAAAGFFLAPAIISAVASGATALFLSSAVTNAAAGGVSGLFTTMKGSLGKLLPRLLKGGGALLAGTALNSIGDSQIDAGRPEVGRFTNVLGGVASGAGAGALATSFIPIPGARVAGAAVGGLVGGMYSMYQNRDSNMPDAQDGSPPENTRQEIEQAARAQAASTVTDEQLERLDKLVGFAPKVRDLSNSVSGLETTFNNLDLDYRQIDRTNRSLEKMATELEEINTQLAGGEQGFFDRLLGNRNENSATAGEVASGARNNNQDQLENLNRVMTDILGVLMQSNDMNRRQLTATRSLTGNLYRS